MTFIRDRKVGTVGTSWTNVDFDVVRPGRFQEIKNLSVYNGHSSQTLDGYIGIYAVGAFRRYYAFTDLQPGAVYQIPKPLYLSDSDHIRVMLKGSGSGTNYEVSFHGFESQ